MFVFFSPFGFSANEINSNNLFNIFYLSINEIVIPRNITFGTYAPLADTKLDQSPGYFAKGSIAEPGNFGTIHSIWQKIQFFNTLYG